MSLRSQSILHKLGIDDEDAANRVLRDLVALSTLPSIWTEADPERIAESLAAALFTTLNPDFVYVAFTDGAGGWLVTVAQTGRYETAPNPDEKLKSVIFSWARDHDPEDFLILTHPLNFKTLHVTTRTLGLNAELGVIAVGCTEKESISSLYQLLLNVAATQAVTSVRNSHLLSSLSESEKQLRTLADSIPQLAWMAEPDGNIFWYNRGWYEYTGTTPEEMKGWGWQSVHDPEILPKVLEQWKKSLATGEPFEMEFPLRGAKGEFRWFLTRVNPLRDRQENITRWFGTNTDIHEKRIAQLNAEFLASIAEDLAHLTGVDEIMETSGARIGAFLNLSSCVFCDVFDSRDELVIDVGWQAEGVPNLLRSYRITEYLNEEFRRMARAGKTIVIRDTETDPRTDAKAHAALGVRSFVAVPFHINGEWKNVLALCDSQPRDWREDEIALIEELSSRIFARVERARSEQERERLLRSEQAARKVAEEANRLKDEFLAVVSHELRTPLNAIIGWSRMLVSNSLEPAKAHSALEIINRNASSQAEIVEDILDISRIITGKLRLNVQLIEPSAVIEQAVDSLRHAAEIKNIRLEVILDSQAGHISGDPERLQQIVWNLLSNAIKFTPRGGCVQVRSERIDSHVEIVVSDTGEGIAPEFLQSVFERFRQADSSSTRKYGGLGLGLSIVKHLVEMHGGVVKVESRGINQGATFTVSLPISIVYSEKTAKPPERLHPKTISKKIALDCPSNLKGTRILAVDDENDSRDLLKAILGKCGAEVLTASSAEEALAVLADFNPQVLICDIGMPGQDGYHLIQQVREREKSSGLKRIPAVALTAYVRIEDRLKALSSGFQMHVPKPVEPAELVTVISSLIE